MRVRRLAPAGAPRRVADAAAFALRRRPRRGDPARGGLAAQAYEAAGELGRPDLPALHEPDIAARAVELAREAGSGRPRLARRRASASHLITVLGGFGVTAGGRALEPPAGRPSTLIKAAGAERRAAGGRRGGRAAVARQPTGRPGARRLRNLLNRCARAAASWSRARARRSCSPPAREVDARLSSATRPRSPAAERRRPARPRAQRARPLPRRAAARGSLRVVGDRAARAPAAAQSRAARPARRRRRRARRNRRGDPAARPRAGGRAAGRGPLPARRGAAALPGPARQRASLVERARRGPRGARPRAVAAARAPARRDDLRFAEQLRWTLVGRPARTMCRVLVTLVVRLDARTARRLASSSARSSTWDRGGQTLVREVSDLVGFAGQVAAAEPVLGDDAGRTDTVAAMSARQRKHWGWGYEDQQPSAADLEGRGERHPRAPRLRRRGRGAGGAGGDRAARAAPAAAGLARPDRQRRSPRPRRATRSARPTATSSAAFAARSTTRPTSSPARATRPRSRRCSAGAPTRARPRSPTAAAPASSAGSSRGSATTTPARSRSTSGRSTGCSRSTASRARRGSRPASLGPSLNEQLAEHGLTLRHFPQSFEYSTLGGWIATRAGGHFATVWTHIDDLVESVRAITPTGDWESRRLPGSGAGPSPDRMLIGSEGILGVITEAWVRVHERPRHKALGGRRLRDLRRGRRGGARARAVGPQPLELPPARRGRGRAHPRRRRRHARCSCSASSRRTSPVDALDGAGARALPRPRRRGHVRAPDDGERAPADGDAVGAWRHAFLAAPYLRDTLRRRAACSRTRSRPRSPGTASRSSTRP